MSGIVDFHSHLIPAVDDGAPDIRHSLEALRQFATQGVTRCITTPHFDGSVTRSAERCAARLAELDAGWEALQAAVALEPGLPALARGTEVMLDDPDPDLSDPRIRLAGGPFVLCEFPAMRLPPNAEWALENMRAKGWRPIIAHPERYRNHDDRLSVLSRCRAAGAYLQVNAGSLLGQHGERATAIARILLEQGWVDYVASDHHARGTPATARAIALIAERGGVQQARRLTEENPARILTGEDPLPVAPMAPQAARKRWWARLFG
ncbi:MAG: tyrosine-protein phosphatase [Gemmatimonadaceae bacterium]